MPVSIHLDDATLKELDAVARESGMSRSSIVRDAVRQWLERNGRSNWNDLLQTLAGSLEDFDGFESNRDDLLEPDANPLGL
jgi:metal-responsive CopG/Arc/MetJ family transcriptional regulator